MINRLLAIVAGSILTAPVQAEEYLCTVTSKFQENIVYSQDELNRHRFSVVIRDNGASAELGRCSFAASEGRITCDFYEVNHIERDEYVGHRKFYVFASQFDVQLFASGDFLENNGRGGIAFGSCEEIG